MFNTFELKPANFPVSGAVQPGRNLRLRARADMAQQFPAPCLVRQAGLQLGGALAHRRKAFEPRTRAPEYGPAGSCRLLTTALGEQQTVDDIQPGLCAID